MSPEAAGFDPGRLAQALAAVRAEVPHVHSVFLAVQGKAFLDAEFYPYDGTEMHNLASVTKSVMTTLIAIAADRGKLRLDQPMLDFFPERTVANLDERKRRITVRHLAGMSSGLACIGEHDEPTLHQMNASQDWVQFALDLPMAAEPGTTFSYCSPGMHLLSAILQQATGMTALDFAREALFAPLGIADVAWPADPQGVTHGWGDLRLFPADAAKIGQLWLDGGRAGGRQIVSEAWVRASASSQIRTGPGWGGDYGLGWWIEPGDIPGFAASGRGGQQISVFPSLGLVAVTTGGGIDPGEVLGRLAAAMVSRGAPLPDDPQGRQALKQVLATLQQPPAPAPPAPAPGLAAEISGHLWRFDPNPLGLAAMRLDFDAADSAGMVLQFAGGPPDRNARIGLDGVPRRFAGEDGVTASMRGAWTGVAEFRAEYDGIAMIDAFDLVLRFDGDTVDMLAKDRTYEGAISLHGERD